MSWRLLGGAEPALLERALHLFSEPHGYAFLATSTATGAPRLHPVAPVVTATEVYLALSAGSPKLRDLRRDPRFALHSSVHPPSDEEASLRGRAIEVLDDERRRAVARERLSGAELHDSMALLSLVPEHLTWTTWRDGSPSRLAWTSGGERRANEPCDPRSP